MVTVQSPSASASEGEIIETDMDKATFAQSDMRSMHVDRPSRRTSSQSTSPSRSSADHKASRYRSRSRSRSRSPFRHRSPRGEKRRHEDGHDDSRRSKVYRSESDRSRAYRDSGRHGRYEDRSDRSHRREHISRSRSRSPFSHSRSHKNADSHNTHSRSDKSSYRNQIDHSSAKLSRDTLKSSRQAELKSILKPPKHDNESSMTQNNGKHDMSDTTNGVTNALESTVIDEAAQIKARRQRREALKARLKGQPTSSLAQEFQSGGESGHTTPKIDAQSPTISPLASPNVDSPRSQGIPESPPAISVENDEELANHRVADIEADIDEPFAADYDPTEDMQEDRARHDHRNHDHDITQSKDSVNQAVSNQNVDINATGGKTDEFDMFADDDEDDDDMFASGPIMKSAKSTNSKQLAANLLDNWDDPDGYYRIILGELLDNRYHVQANLGKGMFSAVVRAHDNITDKLVAIKIIRNNETMRKAGAKEIEVLQALADADPENRKHVIRLERYFDHKGHLCMVFENLSINLREVLKKFGRDVGINLKAVRSYAQQMFLGLGLMKKCNILHADLKPDNMLVNESRNILKICDLGSAGDASENDITPYLVSRFYRAPEIILGIPYDFGIDTWSVGCTLFEMYTGKILFTGRNNNQMLKSIMECRGKFSLKMLKRAEYAGMHFDERLMFMSAERDKVTQKDVIKLLNLLKPTRDLKTRLMSTAKGLGEADMKELNLFADLLDRCLALNPEKRITPSEALKHPFISRSKF